MGHSDILTEKFNIRETQKHMRTGEVTDGKTDIECARNAPALSTIQHIRGEIAVSFLHSLPQRYMLIVLALASCSCLIAQPNSTSRETIDPKNPVVAVAQKDSGVKSQPAQSELDSAIRADGKDLSSTEASNALSFVSNGEELNARSNLPALQGHVRKTRFALFFAPVYPIGDFASTTSNSAGFAKFGFGGGVELSREVVKYFEIGFLGTLCFNPLDESGKDWTTMDFLGSAGALIPVTSSADLRVRGYFGMMVGIYPEIKYGKFFSFTQHGSTAAAFDYGVGLGVEVNPIEFSVRYLTGTPDYEIVTTGPALDSTIKQVQPSGRIVLSLGFMVL